MFFEYKAKSLFHLLYYSNELIASYCLYLWRQSSWQRRLVTIHTTCFLVLKWRVVVFTSHLSKWLDIHIKQLGSVPKYQNDITALAFIPVSDLITACESLSTTFLPVELPILNCFESTWIGIGVGAGGLRRDPVFPHHMLNDLDRHEEGFIRKIFEKSYLW